MRAYVYNWITFFKKTGIGSAFLAWTIMILASAGCLPNSANDGQNSNPNEEDTTTENADNSDLIENSTDDDTGYEEEFEGAELVETDDWDNFLDDDTYSPGPHYRLAGNTRYSVVLEAYYALDMNHNGSSYVNLNTGGGTWTASDWNYLASDTNAFSNVKGWYGDFTSNYCTNSTCSNLNASSYGMTGNYGRGGQCKYFSNLILYRSGVDQNKFPNYGTWYNSWRGKSARCAKPGDVIFKTSDGVTGHVAIVVSILSGNSDSCNVSSLDVVDSNAAGGSDERILRHIINTSGSYFGQDLDNYYVYTGVSYYGDAYGEW